MRRRDFISGLVGVAAAAPGCGHAQPRSPLIAVLHGSELRPPYPGYIQSFLAGLKEQGYEPGRNVAIEYRWAEGHYERGPALAAELLALKPSLAVVYGPPGLVRAAIATFPKDLPIIFGTGGDPIATGIVANYSHPGANVTGFSNRTNSLDVKRIEMLRDLLPNVQVLGLILNPNNSDSSDVRRAAQDGARTLGRRLLVFDASKVEDLDQAYTMALAKGVGAMLMGSDTFLNAHSEHIVRLADRTKLPTLYNLRESVRAGGLISYGPLFVEVYHQMGVYAAKVLRGIKPADLPVVEPAEFELAVNLRTAKTLGLSIPQSILLRATEVIE